MNIDIVKSTQFKINQLSIIMKSGEEVDISSIYEEISFYDCLFLPTLSGKVLITDAIGLSKKMKFDGSESLLVEMMKSEKTDIGGYRKAYRIYKQTDKVNHNLNSQKYILHFVSDELIYSDQQRVNQSYEMTYKGVVERILLDYLKVPVNELTGFFNDSTGIRKVVIPNLKPLEACNWCAKRAIDQYNSPNYLFFRNAIGFHFVPLSKLLTQDNILDIKFELKNRKDLDQISDMSRAKKLEIVSQNDSIDRTRSGVDAGKFIGFDPITRVIATRNISFPDHYGEMSHGNQIPQASVIENRGKQTNFEMFDSKKVVSIFGLPRQHSDYIKRMDPTSISKEDDTENYRFQRLAILKNLINKRIKLIMPGNFQLTSGMNVSLVAPNFSMKEEGSENIDETLSGKYIIVACRQVIGFNKHETYIEIATTSTEGEGVMSSNYAQTQRIIEF